MGRPSAGSVSILKGLRYAPYLYKACCGNVRIMLLATPIIFACAGCGTPALGGRAALPSAPVVAAIAGHAHGGTQPVSGASVQLYAAGAAASAVSVPLLSQPVLTDAAGQFVIPGSYTCPTPQTMVYLAATGGNPGLTTTGSNPSIALMALLGSCGQLSASLPVELNEVTTIASIWPLAGQLQSLASLGLDPTQPGISLNAITATTELANTATGTSPGLGTASGATVPTTKLNALANSLAACINSSGGHAGDGTPCGSLFAYATAAGSPAPDNVVDAALGIAKRPVAHAAEIYALAQPVGPFQPSLVSSPEDWTLPLGAALSAPVISPASGSFIGTQTVSMTATPGTQIRYSTGNMPPTLMSPLYAAPFTLTATTTVLAAAFAGGLRSDIASATYSFSGGGPASSSTNGASTRLAFLNEPASGTPGVSLSPAITVAVEDASGNVVKNGTGRITLSLLANGNAGTLSGESTADAVEGQATFNVSISEPGPGYQLQAASLGSANAVTDPFPLLPPGVSAELDMPAPNACQSVYDQFYAGEPGVYAYWALCETGNTPPVYDYAGTWDINPGFGPGGTVGGATGPVPDGESALKVASALSGLVNQNIPLNSNGGTLAAWINADASAYPLNALNFSGVNGKSSLSLTVSLVGEKVCYSGSFGGVGSSIATVQQCGYPPNTWHRVVFTWGANLLSLYVDGALVNVAPFAGKLDNTLFYYRLFPGCCNIAKQMTLAKVSTANTAWNALQAAEDFAPTLGNLPAGGVSVTTQRLGAIHRDVLGYADHNANLADPSLVNGLLTGLSAGGFSSVRYAGGFGGITADLENWGGGNACTAKPGVTMPAQNVSTLNRLDSYMPQIAGKLGLSAGYTVNYGTNPPACNAGGDPVINGANLVDYANNTKHYGIKYWEIGNELYSYNSETDFHPNPFTGASFNLYEPAFYDSMKAKDSSIKIGVPVSGSLYQLQTGWDLPVLSGAKYDAVIFHNYPVRDPITDGNTLYQDRVQANVGRVRGALLNLQTELLNVGKSADAIWVTEWDDDVYGNEWSRQSLGAAVPMFAAEQLAEYMQAGVQYATWWTQGMSAGCMQTYYDKNGEGAYAWYECGGSFLTYPGNLPGELAVGFKAGDLTPAGRAFQILSQSGFVTEGEHMLRTRTDQANAPWLLAYAATHGASTAVILINRDRDNAHVVPVQLPAQGAGSGASLWSYGRSQYDATLHGDWSQAPVRSVLSPWSGAISPSLPPWSVNVLVLNTP